MRGNTLTGLGFDEKDKVLIVHADDVGMCHSMNMAVVRNLEEGIVTSCSIMAPCPWVLEAVELLERIKADVGVHITLNSEWKLYKWRPLTYAPSLCDDKGYLLSDPLKSMSQARVEDVEEEIRAQVRFLKGLGLRLSHVDTHMGTVYMRKEFFRAYVKAALDEELLPMVPKPTPLIVSWAKAHGIPIDEEYVRMMEELSIPKLDLLVVDIYGTTYEERMKFLCRVLRKLMPGTISQVIVHPGLDTDELKAIIGEDYKLRYFDYKMVMDKRIKELVEIEGIHLIGWRDLLDAWRRIK
ncbi:MAG: hypothetical protein DRN15_10860 [Thermoprotei archaeon]|nr:MAG: hypothetical protein DRN15_10860 [Thermoprotei archaeon]